MESNICMICSNTLSQEEELFQPCECSMKYCFYCFKDLFEKVNGARQGACAQCMKPLKARIQLFHSRKRRKLVVSNTNFLRRIRVINCKGLYLKHLPCDYSTTMLSSENYCGKYGKIVKIAIDLRYFPEDCPNTYRVFIHYFDEISALKAFLALNGCILPNTKIKAEYMATAFCENFIKNKHCYNKNCKFLHEIPNECEWYSLDEKKDSDYFPDLENFNISKEENGGFPDVFVEVRNKLLDNIIVPNRSSKYMPKYIPVSNIIFKNTQTQNSQLNPGKNVRISEYSESLKKNGVKNTKGGIFQLLSDDDNE